MDTMAAEHAAAEALAQLQVSEVYSITAYATRFNPVHVISTGIPADSSDSTSTIVSGSFTLELDMRPVGSCWPPVSPFVDNSQCNPVAVTTPIDHEAVPASSDERTTYEPGSGLGDSMESKLRALANIGGMDVRVTRSSNGGQGGYTWSVTWLNSPHDMPLLRVVDNVLAVNGGTGATTDSFSPEVKYSQHVSVYFCCFVICLCNAVCHRYSPTSFQRSTCCSFCTSIPVCSFPALP